MITKKSQEILELFTKNILLEVNVITLSKMLGTAYPKVYNTVKQLNKEEIITVRDFGNEKLCSINLTDKTISILAYIEEEKAFKQSIPNIKEILEIKDLEEDIFIVTGSYASKKNAKKSDVDIVIIASKDIFSKQKLLENKTSLMDPEIHPIIISDKDFIQMLTSKEANFGKELFKNKFIFRNAQKYYRILRGVNNNGIRN